MGWYVQNAIDTLEIDWPQGLRNSRHMGLCEDCMSEAWGNGWEQAELLQLIDDVIAWEGAPKRGGWEHSHDEWHKENGGWSMTAEDMLRIRASDFHTGRDKNFTLIMLRELVAVHYYDDRFHN